MCSPLFLWAEGRILIFIFSNTPLLYSAFGVSFGAVLKLIYQNRLKKLNLACGNAVNLGYIRLNTSRQLCVIGLSMKDVHIRYSGFFWTGRRVANRKRSHSFNKIRMIIMLL